MKQLSVMIVVVAMVLWCGVAIAQEGKPAAGAAGDRADGGDAVVSEFVELTTSTVRVSVLDGSGAHRRGLETSDFVVVAGGETMEIVSVAEITPEHPRGGDKPSHLVILVDNANLQKRNRKKVLSDVASLADAAISKGAVVMVAALGERMEIAQEFTSNRAAIEQCLHELADAEAVGERLSSSKRAIVREIRSVDLHRDMHQSGPVGGTYGQEYIGVQGQQFLQRIHGLREQDMERWRATLFWVNHALRTLGGLQGPKDLLWVTEDIQVSPLFDVYMAFFAKFSQWQRELGLEHPEVWARDGSLADSFSQLAMIADGAGVALHVMDLSNSDRRSADMAMDVSDTAMFAAGTPSGERTSTGDELAASGTSTGSARAMAEATGGRFFSGIRDYGKVMNELADHLYSYYEIDYQKQGSPDGQLHPLKVTVAGGSDHLAYPRMVGHRTALQELADRTLTRLYLGAGDNQLGASLHFGATEPADEGKLIRTIHVDVATDALRFEKQDETLVGSLVLLFQSMDANGMALPPQVLQQPISLPAGRLSDTRAIRASARLMTAMDAPRLAVGVLDQLSGAEGTAVAELGG